MLREVEWIQFKRRLVDHKYELWHYGKNLPYVMDEQLEVYRQAIAARKPWKAITPGWFEHLMSYWQLGLTWEGKEDRTPTWKTRLGEFRYDMTYVSHDLMARILDASQEMDTKIEIYDIDMMLRRKPWKRLTEAHVRCVIANFGGSVVEKN